MVGESAFSVGVSIVTLMNVGNLLGRDTLFGFGNGRGVANARTRAVANTAKALGASRWRGILMDYDTWIGQEFAEQLADDIRTADERNLNLVAPMRTIDGKWNVYDKDNRPLEQLPPNLSRVHCGGLGFYYGDVVSGYRFHEGDNDLGEDMNYYLDNRLPLNVVTDVEFKHIKPTPL